jgi:hypothetical protein
MTMFVDDQNSYPSSLSTSGGVLRIARIVRRVQVATLRTEQRPVELLGDLPGKHLPR